MSAPTTYPDPEEPSFPDRMAAARGAQMLADAMRATGARTVAEFFEMMREGEQ